VTTLINLTYRYLFWGHGGGVIVGDEPLDSQELPVAGKTNPTDCSSQRAKPNCPQ